MKSNPLVSIIIVNWNGGTIFKDCLTSLSKLDYKKWELILVDNGSTDNSQFLIDNFSFPAGSARLIQNKENKGFAPANNQGYKKAKGKYILLLNNDTKVTPEFLTLLIERAESDEQIGVIQPKIYLMDTKKCLDNAGSFITRIGFLSHWGFMQKDSDEFAKEREIFSAKGACMLIRKSIVDKIGLFDDDFVSYFEESDFCWRVWIYGYKVLFFPNAFIYHKLGYTIKRQNVLNLNFHYYKNRILSQIKNLEFKNLIFILGIHLIISLGIATVFLARFQFGPSAMIVGAIIWNVRNIPKSVSKRRKIKEFRKSGDKEIFSRVSTIVDWAKFFRDFKRVENDIKTPIAIKSAVRR